EWERSERLGVDLVCLVFHEYLRVIKKYDDRYVVSLQLTVTEKDYQRWSGRLSECLSGQFQRVVISFNISSDYPLRCSTSYVNRSAFDSEVPTTFRVYRSQSLCTSTPYRFELLMGDFSKTVYLQGSDHLTVRVPSG